MGHAQPFFGTAGQDAGQQEEVVFPIFKYPKSQLYFQLQEHNC